MPVTVLTKTDGSLGRVKQEQPLNSLVPVDLDYYESAEEHERIKDALIEHADAINDLETSIGDLETSVSGSRRRVIYEMPISVTPAAPTLTAVYVRGTGDTGSATGVASVSVQASQSDPSLNVLRFSASAGSAWIWPIDLGAVALPAEGYVLEVEIDKYPASTWYGLIAPLLDIANESGTDVARGLYMRSWNGAVNIDWMSSGKTSGPYAHMTDMTPSPTLVHWPSTPSDANLVCGPCRLRCEVRRLASQTPARWSMRYTAEGIGQINGAAISCVSETVSSLDGKALGHIGIGVYGGAADFDIRSLIVTTL